MGGGIRIRVERYLQVGPGRDAKLLSAYKPGPHVSVSCPLNRYVCVQNQWRNQPIGMFWVSKHPPRTVFMDI